MAPGPDPKGLPRPKMYLELALAMLRLAPWLLLLGFKTDWRMAACPDRKGVPRPKLSLELAFAMLRLAPWLVLSGFKTDGWPPVPIPKASPGPKCIWSCSWLLPCCGWRPGWFYRISKLTDGPRSRSQRPPHAQNVVGAGFSHAAAGALAGFIGFQNWRMAPCPDPKGFPRPKLSLELAFAMLRQLFCGRCFLCHACYACLSACQRVVEQGFPDGVACVTWIRPDKRADHTAVPHAGHLWRCCRVSTVAAYSAVVHLPCLHIAPAKGTFCPRRARPWPEIARRADATLGRYGPRWSRPLHKQGNTGHAYRNSPASVALAGVPQPESCCCISVPVCSGGAVFFPFLFASLLRLRGPPWPLRTSPFFSDRVLGSTGGTVTAWPVRGLTGTGFGGRVPAMSRFRWISRHTSAMMRSFFSLASFAATCRCRRASLAVALATTALASRGGWQAARTCFPCWPCGWLQVVWLTWNSCTGFLQPQAAHDHKPLAFLAQHTQYRAPARFRFHIPSENSSFFYGHRSHRTSSFPHMSYTHGKKYMPVGHVAPRKRFLLSKLCKPCTATAPLRRRVFACILCKPGPHLSASTSQA